MLARRLDTNDKALCRVDAADGFEPEALAEEAGVSPLHARNRATAFVGSRRVMLKEARVATLLAKAKEADEMAGKARGQEAREAWAKVASGYRHLARLAKTDED